MKDVQCYELFGGIALKNYSFSFFIYIAHICSIIRDNVTYECFRVLDYL